MYTIPDEINAKPRLLGLEIKELIFFIIGLIIIFTVLKDMVHQIFIVPYYLISVGTLLYLFLPSSNNSNRKNYHSLVYFFKKDKTTYKPISVMPEFNNEMEKEVYQENQQANIYIPNYLFKEYEDEIARAKEKYINNDKEMYYMDENNQNVNYQEKQPENNENNQGSDKRNPLKDFFKKPKNSVGSIIALIVVVSLVSVGVQGVSGSDKDDDTKNDESNESKQDIFFEESLKSASVKDYDNASLYLDKVNYDELDQEEKDIMLSIFLYADSPEKALKKEQSYDTEIARYYKEVEDSGKLKELAEMDNVDTGEFKYELAIMEGDNKRVVNLRDQIALTDKRKREIVDALISLGEFDDAKTFIEHNDMSDEQLTKVKNAEKDNEDDDD